MSHRGQRNSSFSGSYSKSKLPPRTASWSGGGKPPKSGCLGAFLVILLSVGVVVGGISTGVAILLWRI